MNQNHRCWICRLQNVPRQIGRSSVDRQINKRRDRETNRSANGQTLQTVTQTGEQISKLIDQWIDRDPETPESFHITSSHLPSWRVRLILSCTPERLRWTTATYCNILQHNILQLQTQSQRLSSSEPLTCFHSLLCLFPGKDKLSKLQGDPQCLLRSSPTNDMNLRYNLKKRTTWASGATTFATKPG